MWISKKLSQSAESSKAEKGKITIASSSAPEAGASVNSRSAATYMPYGYNCTLPVGEEVLLLPCAEGSAVLGTRAKASALEAGEIEIVSKGGASIKLANDGAIYLNGRLFMNGSGVIEAEL